MGISSPAIKTLKNKKSIPKKMYRDEVINMPILYYRFH
jgi:hypothetical protein